MSDQKKSEKQMQNVEKPREVEDTEAEGIVGGTFTQAQYDEWERMGPTDRSNFGPGAGE